MMRLIVLSAVVIAMISVACGGGDDDGGIVPQNTQVRVEDFATPAGYWEGSGTATHTPWDDPVRHFYRKADYEFWFALDTEGTALGEITLTYDAKLTIDGLPDFSAPAPGGINVSFEPEVGGELSSADPVRTFPLVGVYNEEENILRLRVVNEDFEPLKFTLRADPGVSAAVPLDSFGEETSDDVSPEDLPGDPGTNEGDVGADGEGEGDGETIDVSDPGFLAIVHVYDMTPFTPFADEDEPAIEKRPGGPHDSSFDLAEGEWAVNWSAQQKTADVQTVEINPAMRQALQDILDAQ